MQENPVPDKSAFMAGFGGSSASGEDRKSIFLAALRWHGNVSAAAQTAGYSRRHFYHLRQSDATFAADWADALEGAADRFELEAVRRAVDGVEETRFYQGAAIGAVQRYSDRLLMFLLKARRPGVFDARMRAGVHPQGDSDDVIRDKIERRLARHVQKSGSDGTKSVSG